MVAANGRDAKGRFLKGHSVKSPGRPPREVEQEFIAAFRRGCPPSALEAITATMAKLAIAGDVNAAKLLMSHCLPISARLELLNWTDPEDAYRVAGQSPSQTSDVMLRRVVDAVKRNRERDRAAGVYRPTDSRSKVLGDSNQST